MKKKLLAYKYDFCKIYKFSLSITEGQHIEEILGRNKDVLLLIQYTQMVSYDIGSLIISISAQWYDKNWNLIQYLANIPNIS